MKKNIIITITITLLIVIISILIGKKIINNTKTHFDNDDKNLVFKLESRMLKCLSPTLYVYDNNTYEYYYTYTSSGKKLIPKKGTYNYDINLILNNITELKEDEIGSYYLIDSNNNGYSLAYNEQLDNFLNLIDINMHRCIEEQ